MNFQETINSKYKHLQITPTVVNPGMKKMEAKIQIEKQDINDLYPTNSLRYSYKTDLVEVTHKVQV